MKRPLLWLALLPFFLFLAFIYLRLGNGFVERTGRVHVAYEGERGYHFVRNGDPFYVLGASGDAYFAELKKYGGNTIRIYQPDSLPTALEQASRFGLAVIADLPLPKYNKSGDGFYGVPAKSDSILKAVIKTVAKYKNHPALLCWMLGNEINYSPGEDIFKDDYDALIAAIRKEDPDHPIGTAMISHQLIKMHLSPRSAGLDFIALNIFGSLSDFETKKNWFRVAWTGPYLFSEWGNNGPWESEETAWGAPLEPTSAKKAELLTERYQSHVGNPTDGRCLGSLAFYWGQKQERTHTWFGFFSDDGHKSQACHALENLWLGKNENYTGIAINYLLLEGKGAHENLVFQPGAIVAAEAFYHEWGGRLKSFKWSVRKEDWFYVQVDSMAPPKLPQLVMMQTPDGASFLTPERPGPYRLHLEVVDSADYFAYANVPFYVLNPPASD